MPSYEAGSMAAVAEDVRSATGQRDEELAPFVLTEEDFRNRLSPILESSRHAKKVPGLKSLLKGLLEVVER